MNYLQGTYKPVFVQKYNGDPTNIVYRSSWELRFMKWADSNPAVVKWSSEETVIPYLCPTDNRVHRYFVDFKIQVRTSEGLLKSYLIEVKPDSQTRPPTRSKNSKRYMTEVMTWGKNDAKWKAAREYCSNRGMEFVILTEYHLGLATKKAS